MPSFIDPYTKVDYGDLANVNPENIKAAIAGASPEGKLALLKSLRSQLNDGQIEVADFIKLGQPLAQAVSQDTLILGGQGSKNAQRGQAIYQDFKANSGFGQKMEGHADVVANLPKEYEQKVRNSILPGNIDEATRKQIIDDIPDDISLTSDRGQIEREAIRERGQAKAGLDERSAFRKTALNDLAGILAKQQSEAFGRSIPQVAEDANSAGIFRSTGYGEALARKQQELTTDTTNALSLKGIQDRDLTALGMGDILDSQLGMQQSGLQRQFSLDDFTKNVDVAKALAEANKPQSQGKSSGEKWAQGIQAGIGVGGLVAAPFTGGATLPAAFATVPRPGGASNSTSASRVPVGRGQGKA